MTRRQILTTLHGPRIGLDATGALVINQTDGRQFVFDTNDDGLMVSVNGTLYPPIVISDLPPDDDDGRADGTIYLQYTP